MTFSGQVAQSIDGSSQEEVYSEKDASSGSRVLNGKVTGFPTTGPPDTLALAGCLLGNAQVGCLELKDLGKKEFRGCSTFLFVRVCLIP